MEIYMKKFVLSAAIIALTATSTLAGGPVIVGGEPAVIVNPPSAGGVGIGPIVGVIGGLALLCLIACGGTDSAGTTITGGGEGGGQF
jgi:hypothetical protein